jgi:hypothetical protein
LLLRPQLHCGANNQAFYKHLGCWFFCLGFSKVLHSSGNAAVTLSLIHLNDGLAGEQTEGGPTL